MNEKIKELYDDASYSSYVRTDGNGNDHYRRSTDYELFAELIIEECASRVDHILREKSLGGGTYGNHIKEHFGIVKGGVMTPEVKKQFYQDRLAEIRRGGNTSHSVFVTDYIGGHGSNLGPVDPPVVGLVGDDHYYAQYFQNWDELNAFILELQTEATKAWGPQYHQYHHSEDRMTIDPVTGDVGIGGVKFDTSGDLMMGFSNRTIPTRKNGK